jgi:hypothetical protein
LSLSDTDPLGTVATDGPILPTLDDRWMETLLWGMINGSLVSSASKYICSSATFSVSNHKLTIIFMVKEFWSIYLNIWSPS